MALAVRSVQINRSRTSVLFLAATVLLGLAFLGIKFYEYEHKFREHLVPGRRFSLSGLLEHERKSASPVAGTIVELGPAHMGIEREGKLFSFPVTAETSATIDGRQARIDELSPGQAVEIAAAVAGRAETVRAVTPRVELFFSFYFAMTGFHALHMVIGICVVAVIAILAGRGRFGSAYFTPVEMTGLYWHFVDVVWVFLFPLLYLIDLSR